MHRLPILLTAIALLMLTTGINNWTFGEKFKMDAKMPAIVESSQRRPGKPTIAIVCSANYGGPAFSDGPIETVSMKLALDAAINSSFLKDYNIVIKMFDDKCIPTEGISIATTVMNSLGGELGDNIFPLMLGPMCDANSVVSILLPHYNMVSVAALTARKEHFADRSLYRSFFVVQESFESWFEAVPAFIKTNGWAKAYIVSDTWNYWNPYVEVMVKNFDRYNITLQGLSRLTAVPGDLFPTDDQTVTIVNELISLKSRIIVIATHSAAFVACSLHRHGLFGPNFVYIVFGYGYIDTIAAFRPDWCTGQMLYEFQQSIIYYYHAQPLSVDPDAVDSLGVTGRMFDKNLKDNIEDVESYGSIWFPFRINTYSHTTAALLALEQVEKDLRSNNDTLINWVTSTENFKRNGSFIRTKLESHLNKLRFKMLITAGDRLNQRTGKAGFFQLQRNQANLKYEPIPVASFDTTPGATFYAKVVHGPRPYIWNTWDKMAPPDSIRTFSVVEPIMNQVADGVIKALSLLILIANVISIVYDCWKIRCSVSLFVIGRLPKIGNILMLIGVLVMPVEGNLSTPHSNCMASTFFIVIGFFNLTCSISAKLSIASASIQFQRKQISEVADRAAYQTKLRVSSNRKALSPMPSGGSEKKSSIDSPSPVPQMQNISAAGTSNNNASYSVKETVTAEPGVKTALSVPVVTESRSSNRAKMLLPAVIVWIFVQILILAIWFGVSPVETSRFDRLLQNGDASHQYQFYSMVCRLTPKSQVFIYIHLACYLMVVLCSTYYGFALRNARISTNATELSDVHLVRIAAYSIDVYALVGGSVTYAFFSKRADDLQIAVVSIILAITALATIIGNIRMAKNIKASRSPAVSIAVPGN